MILDREEEGGSGDGSHPIACLSLLEECLLDCKIEGQRAEAAREKMLALDEYLLECVFFIPEKQESKTNVHDWNACVCLVGFLIYRPSLGTKIPTTTCVCDDTQNKHIVSGGGQASK